MPAPWIIPILTSKLCETVLVYRRERYFHQQTEHFPECGYLNGFYCSAVPYSSFADCEVQFHCSANADIFYTRAVPHAEQQMLSSRQEQPVSCCTTTPSPGSERGIDCRQTDKPFLHCAVQWQPPTLSVLSASVSTSAPGKHHHTFSDPWQGICWLSALVEGVHLAAVH